MTALHIIQGSNDISPQLVISNMIAHLVKSTRTIYSFRRERRKSSDRRLSPIQKHSFLTFFSDSIHLLMAMTEDPVRSLRAKIASITIWIVAILIVCQGFSLLSTLTSIIIMLSFFFFSEKQEILKEVSNYCLCFYRTHQQSFYSGVYYFIRNCAYCCTP